MRSKCCIHSVMAEEKEEVKVLYHWASPFVMRVIFALELKGIPYQIHEEDFSNKSQLLLQSNPIHKKIPVLIHNGKPVVESAIIVEYIEEAWPEQAGFFPKDPYARAQARFWGDFVDKKILKPMMQFVRSASGNKEFIESCITLEDVLSKEEDDNPFLGGKKTTAVGFADIMLLPYTVWIPAFVEEVGMEMPGPEECPNLHKLFSHLRDLPAAKVALPELQKLREYIRSRVNVWRENGV